MTSFEELMPFHALVLRVTRLEMRAKRLIEQLPTEFHEPLTEMLPVHSDQWDAKERAVLYLLGVLSEIYRDMDPVPV